MSEYTRVTESVRSPSGTVIPSLCQMTLLPWCHWFISDVVLSSKSDPFLRTIIEVELLTSIRPNPCRSLLTSRLTSSLSSTAPLMRRRLTKVALGVCTPLAQYSACRRTAAQPAPRGIAALVPLLYVQFWSKLAPNCQR